MFHVGFHIWELTLTTDQMDPDFDEQYGVGTFCHSSIILSPSLRRFLCPGINICIFRSYSPSTS